MRRAQGGDEGALDELLERYRLRVRAVVRRRLGRGLRQMFDSEDLVQESLTQAFLGFERFEPRHEGALLDWFAGIVERRIREAARHAGRQKRERGREVSLPAASENGRGGDEPIDPATSPLGAVGRAEDRERVLGAMRSLPAKQREALRLRSAEGRPWSEVAERLDCPSADAARMVYTRALSALRVQLDSARHERPQRGQGA